MKFTVQISKWRCGFEGENKHGQGSTQLLNTQGYMCCLGFCCLQLGLSEEDIICRDRPSEVYDEKDLITILKNSHLLGRYNCNTALAHEAMLINDSTITTLHHKIVELRKLFEEYGHEIEFVE